MRVTINKHKTLKNKYLGAKKSIKQNQTNYRYLVFVSTWDLCSVITIDYINHGCTQDCNRLKDTSIKLYLAPVLKMSK